MARGGVPVTLVDSGGWGISEGVNNNGLEVTVVESGGLKCTLIDSGGYPVIFTDVDGALDPGGGATGARIALSATTVSEASPAGSTVAIISVTDATGTPTFAEVADNDAKFRIVGTELILDAVLDYETASTHDITISATGTTPLPNNRTFTISVINVTEPVIQLSASTVAEDASLGTTIGAISLSGTYTGTPTFAIAADPDGKFTLSGDNLQTDAALDYETDTSHSVTISVSGVTPPAANADFAITVTNVADSTPVIQLSASSILESASVADVIGNLTVSGDYTGVPSFSEVADPSTKFTVSGDELRVGAALDYETATFHTVTIGVSGITPSAANREFTINVVDVVGASEFAVYDPDTLEEAPVTTVPVSYSGFSNGTPFAANTLSPTHGYNPAGTCFTSSSWSNAGALKYLQATDYDNFLFRSKYFSRDHSFTGYVRNGEVLLRLTSGKAWVFRLNVQSNTMSIYLQEGLTENTHSPIGNSADTTYYAYSGAINTLILAVFGSYDSNDTDGHDMKFAAAGLDLVFSYSMNGTDFSEIVRLSPTRSYAGGALLSTVYQTWLHMEPGAVAVAHITTYGVRQFTVDYDDTPTTYLSNFTDELHVADLGVKDVSTFGTMSASSTSLTVISATGFAIGDYIIVDTTGTASGGALGSVGPGGSWPSLRYANAAAMNADSSQAANTVCSLTSTGYTYQYVSGVWQQLLTYSVNNLYIHKSLPLALRARITNIVSNVLTLDTACNAAGAVSDSEVFHDNEPLLAAHMANTTYNVTIPALEWIFPDDDVIIGEPLAPYGRPGWSISGAGSGIANSTPTGLTRFFGPYGCPSASMTLRSYCVEAKDMFFDCGAYILFPQLGTHQMTQASISVDYPYGFALNNCDNSIVSNIRTKQQWQKAVGLIDCNDVAVNNCTCEMTDALTRYVQWQFQSSGSANGNIYTDCEMDADYLTTFCEPFSDDGTTYIRCVARNGYSSNNSARNTVYTDHGFYVEGSTRYSAISMSVSQPIAQTNGNFSPGVASNVTWTRLRYKLAGYVDAANEQPKGIVVSSGDGSIIDACVMDMLTYNATSTGSGAVGVDANSDTTISSTRVDGTTINAFIGNLYGYGASNTVVVTSSIADRVVNTSAGSGSDSGNQTTAVAGTDRTPTALSFTAVTGATGGTQYTSNEVTIAGVNAMLRNVALTSNGKFIWNGGGTGSTFIRDNDHWLLNLLINGDKIKLVATASMTPSAVVTVTFTVASGVSYDWTITTAAGGGGVTWVMDDGTWDDSKTWQDTGTWVD